MYKTTITLVFPNNEAFCSFAKKGLFTKHFYEMLAWILTFQKYYF